MLKIAQFKYIRMYVTSMHSLRQQANIELYYLQADKLVRLSLIVLKV